MSPVRVFPTLNEKSVNSANSRNQNELLHELGSISGSCLSHMSYCCCGSILAGLSSFAVITNIFVTEFVFSENI